ncbi:hypothetical protein CABS01_03102 [Colletotrichum abscissum]|uniref:DUF7587 domain-containing protein n=1 Tax=Colletotrichum abscissum TaxID=1671311 RepID=A0A9Q0AX08_9PEZI|nr:uncharacterized protein CABS01_03102 [Colletotrichum abscissum]KAI3541395.1 hypothetical protein CABS02_10789 [Colletotrichum abscissum]KAK1477800.1 hypothetical protein CABS01_03102 [Colletotrichum abscissum]
MAHVPSQELVVARYKLTSEKIADNDSSNVKAWLTKNTTHNIPWVLRVLPDYVSVLRNQFPGYLDIIQQSRNTGCVNGTALLSITQKVSTVGGDERPEQLYRTIHGGQPHQGIKSRLGRGSDPIFLHIHLRKHLRGNCREPSPFLSATSSRARAVEFAVAYEDQGFSNIAILVFETTSADWNHNTQRLWDSKALLRRLNKEKKAGVCFGEEFLVEHSIPETSIQRRYNWPSDKAKIDPRGFWERRARKALESKKKSIEEAKEKKASKKRKNSHDEDGDDDEGNDEELVGGGVSKRRQKNRKQGVRVIVGPKLRRDGGA